MKFLDRILTSVAAAVLAGCGVKSPPAVAVPAAPAVQESPPLTDIGLQSDVYGDPATPVAGKVLGTVIHTQEAEELRYVVLTRLTDQYADQQHIVVTPAEKDAYVAHVRAFMEEDRARRQAAGEQVPADTAADAAEESDEDRAARLEIAAAFIRQWKINRALYQQYGGRIGYQQGGPEPLDAYRRFLEERAARGDFRIANPDLETAFWRYYRDDSIHEFVEPGSAAEATTFTDPPWLADKSLR